MLGLSSCQSIPAPKGEICILDGVNGVGHCYDGVTEKKYDKSLADLHRYILRSSDYDQKLAEWCVEGWRRAGEKTNEY